MLYPRRALAFACLFVVALPLFAASAPRSPSPPGRLAEEKPKTFSDLFGGLQFRNIGPFRGGRVTAVTGVRHDPLTFYFGATGGGVWKTSDGGSN